MIAVKHNVHALNDTIREYIAASRITTQQALYKKGYDLLNGVPGHFEGLRDRLMRLKPNGITQERLDAFKRGEGIKVRPGIIQRVKERQNTLFQIVHKAYLKSITRKPELAPKKKSKKLIAAEEELKRDKGLTVWQMAVRRELKAREAGRGYTAYGVSMRNIRKTSSEKLTKHFGRINQLLGQSNLSADAQGGAMTFTFGSPEATLGQSLQKPKAQAIIASALSDLRKDMATYISRKHRESLEGTLSRRVKATPVR